MGFLGPVGARDAAIAVAPAGAEATWAEGVMAAAGMVASPFGPLTEALVWIGFHDPEVLAGALRKTGSR